MTMITFHNHNRVHLNSNPDDPHYPYFVPTEHYNHVGRVMNGATVWNARITHTRLSPLMGRTMLFWQGVVILPDESLWVAKGVSYIDDTPTCWWLDPAPDDSLYNESVQFAFETLSPEVGLVGGFEVVTYDYMPKANRDAHVAELHRLHHDMGDLMARHDYAAASPEIMSRSEGIELQWQVVEDFLYYAGVDTDAIIAELR